MKNKINTFAKVGLFFAVGGIMLFLVYRHQNIAFQADCALKGVPSSQCSLLDKVLDDISGANYFWIILTLVFFMITNVFRALRWKMMLVAIGYQPKFLNLLSTIMVNYLANLGIPRSGEVIRAGLISKYENIPLEKALGTIFTDRIFDVLMLLIVIGLALLLGGNDFLIYLDKNIDLSSKFAFILDNPIIILLVLSLLTGGMIYAFKNKAKIEATAIGKKVVNLFTGFADGVQSVRGVSSVPLFAFYTIGIWVFYYLMTYIAFFSFAPTAHLGPIAGLIVFVFGSLGIVIPTPGGMGSYHFLVGEALAMYGVAGSDAFSFANIIFFSIQILINVVLGIISLILLPIINKD